MYFTNKTTNETRDFGILKPNPCNWQEASCDEIDALLLEEAKAAKLAEMKMAYQDFIDAGFSYDGDVFCLTDCGLKNVDIKDQCSPLMPDRFKFCDTSNEPHDSGGDTDFRQFKLALFAEKDRIMFDKYNPYKVLIRDAATVEEVDAIIIDFSAD